MPMNLEQERHEVTWTVAYPADEPRPWSYGGKSNVNGVFIPLTVARSFSAGGVPLEDWVVADNQIPQVLHSPSSSLTFDSGEGP